MVLKKYLGLCVLACYVHVLIYVNSIASIKIGRTSFLNEWGVAVSSKHLSKNLAESVGKFIEYWGFRDIHGRIWTVVYLSSEPVSIQEILERLQVSESILNDALSEMVDHGLIDRLPALVAREFYYSCSEDIGGVIRRVLKNRELVTLERSHSEIEALNSESTQSLRSSGISKKRLKQLSSLVQTHKKLLSVYTKVRFSALGDWKQTASLAASALKWK